jgi:V/A-type H+-transporting ATPase subunit B
MPSGDITHPIPDLTGYVTEGQIVLDRELDRRGVYPPVAALPSLSRLMNDGIGAGRTREDHADVSRQLYASCARVARARALESIIGREELSEVERQYLDFGEAFEQQFLTQRIDEARPVADTLDLAWATLALLPDHELNHLPFDLLRQVRERLRSVPGVGIRGAAV